MHCYLCRRGCSLGTGEGTIWSAISTDGFWDVVVTNLILWVGAALALTAFIFCGWGIGISAKLCAGGHRTSRDPKLSQKLQNDTWRRSGIIVGLLVLFVVMLVAGGGMIDAHLLNGSGSQFLHETGYWIGCGLALASLSCLLYGCAKVHRKCSIFND